MKQKLGDLGREVCSFYAALNSESQQNNIDAWRLTPKLHLFAHLCEHQVWSWGNPRWYWCYADEDMVGHMIEVASACH
eukprot:2262452-Karenia_brevis.AAC.1